MDDVVLYALEHIAFDGSKGASIDQLWLAVGKFYAEQGLAQTIDRPYQEYLWTIFSRCGDLFVGRRRLGAGNVLEFQDIASSTDNLASLEAEYGGTLMIRVSQERQWVTLTGHSVDSKKIPPLSFACLSSISGSRATGISLIDLYKETGQDKRSAPARCKRLAEQGLVHGFPILSHGANTTLYVHHRFLAQYIRQRAGQDGGWGKDRTLDLHQVRCGISDLLKNSTSQILKTRDCCALMKMNSDQADAWTQTRFYWQLRVMAARGFIRLVRVPGKLTGTLIRCAQLIKEYSDSDKFAGDQSNAEPEEVEEESGLHQDDQALLARQENLEELDLSTPASQQKISEPVLAKDLLLEWTIMQAVRHCGSDGISGPEVCMKVVGSHWSRPIDEQLKRVCPDSSWATQPLQYAGLALPPAVQETLGKTRQFRYFSKREAGKARDLEPDPLVPVQDRDGLLPDLEPSLDLMTAVPTSAFSASIIKEVQTPKRGRPRKSDISLLPSSVASGTPDATASRVGDSSASPSNAISNVTPHIVATPANKKRGRPSKAMLAERNALLGRPALDLNSTAAQSPTIGSQVACRGPADKSSLGDTQAVSRPNTVGCTPENVISPDQKSKTAIAAYNNQEDSRLVTYDSHSPDKFVRQKSAETANAQNQTPIFAVARGKGDVAEPPLKRVKVGSREALRRSSTNNTAKERERLLLGIIASAGGLVSLDLELVGEFDRKLQEETGVAQSTDKNTIKRTLEACKQLKWVVRTFSNSTGKKINRHIYFFNAISEDDAKFKSFIAKVKTKERTQRPSQAPHKPMEIVPRPDMIVLPTNAEVQNNQGRLRQINLSKGVIGSGLHMLLPQKDSTLAPRTKDLWFAGQTLLNSWRETRAAAKQIREAQVLADEAGGTIKSPRISHGPRPKLKPPISQAFFDIQGKHHTDEESDEARPVPNYGEDLAPHRTAKHKKTRSLVKKAVSRRGDRFAIEDEDVLDTGNLSAHTLPRQRLHIFSDTQDDTIIRAATLSMLFFPKSDLQPKIEWDLVDLVVGRPECRKRYPGIRGRTQHRKVQSFIQSETFTKLYNDAVLQHKLSPVPQSFITASGQLFDLTPLIHFSRQFDIEESSMMEEELPHNIQTLYSDYEVQLQEGSSIIEGFDTLYSEASSFLKSDLLAATAFYSADRAAEEQSTNMDNLISAIKSLLLTPQTDYDSERGQALLLQYATREGAEALLQTMIKDNLVVVAKSGNGPGHQMSERFFNRARASISKRTLRTAFKYLTSLKQTLAPSQKVSYPALSNNGATLCTLELALRGQVTLEQGEKKWSDFGLIQGYGVRQIDPSRLDFSIKLKAGHSPMPDLIAQGGPRTMPTLPCFWIDIHGKVMQAAYDGALSLLVSLLVTRGCMSVTEMLHCCAPVFVRHELTICLQDLQRADCVEERDGLYHVTGRYYGALA